MESINDDISSKDYIVVFTLLSTGGPPLCAGNFQLELVGGLCTILSFYAFKLTCKYDRKLELYMTYICTTSINFLIKSNNNDVENCSMELDYK